MERPALAGTFSQVRVGDPFSSQTQVGPLAAQRQRDRVEGYIAKGIYGLNASVFTNDVNRARQVAARLRSGTVGHNAMRTDFGVSFGGFKQSGIGREGVHEGLPHFLETKFVIMEGQPEGYENTTL